MFLGQLLLVNIEVIQIKIQQIIFNRKIKKIKKFKKNINKYYNREVKKKIYLHLF
jgi:hypothetical protein